MTKRFLFIASLLLACGPALADGPNLKGEWKIQQDALLAKDKDSFSAAVGDTAYVTSSSLRLKAEGGQGTWSYDVHYLLEGEYSRHDQELRALATPEIASNLFDLEGEIGNGSDTYLQHRLDRAWIAHSTPHTVLRIGRQALTWGHGQVFHPLDLFNPFAPDATDTSYKPGADMLYGQYLFDSGDDIQLLAVPRRNASGSFDQSESSYAVKGLTMIGSVESNLIAARDHGDTVIAAGFAGPLGDALWKADIVNTFKDEGGTALSGVASLQNSWSWAARPITGFVEYYRNGYGVTDRRAVDRLPIDLTDRIARGQVFNTGRDYIALGGTVDWTPLLQIAPTLITNIDDGSALGIASATYSLSDNMNLIAGAQVPIGRRRTEFGGRETSVGSGEYNRSPARLFLRLETYF